MDQCYKKVEFVFRAIPILLVLRSILELSLLYMEEELTIAGCICHPVM